MNNVKVQKFVSSIDYNPDRRYLNAVKKIHINTDLPIDKDIIYKLLFRFPSPTEVQIGSCKSLLGEITDEMCQELLQKCPMLTRYELDENAY